MKVSYIDRMLTQSMALIEKIIAMDPSHALIDLDHEIIDKTNKSIYLCYSETFRSKNQEFVQKVVRWMRTWKLLHVVLLEGWNLREARSQALAAQSYLRAIAEIYQEMKNRERSSSTLKHWTGDSIPLCVRQAVTEMETNRSSGVKKLFQIIKKILLLSEHHYKQEAVQDFFCCLARLNYKISFSFLDVMGYDDRELKDIALLCILIKCPLAGINETIPLLKKFSSEDKIQEGIKTLFLNCVNLDIELAHLLIKKMVLRADRNESYGILALACARKGNFHQAILFSEFITAIVLKQSIDRQIANFMPDNRPIYKGDDLLRVYKKNLKNTLSN